MFNPSNFLFIIKYLFKFLIFLIKSFNFGDLLFGISCDKTRFELKSLTSNSTP